ncbi:MAG TPA: AbrB family transcriptional regulator [Candidatus Bathyarchaeota archaeon]|nr:AbrB family transcriptional regulator [Candidatus Bathyarchaeota archaeon]
MWVVGVGKIVEMDDRGRITIPAEIRRRIGRDVFIIELVDRDTILLRAVDRGEELIKRFEAIRLSGDRERRSYDAAYVKDLYGGIRDRGF